MSDPRAATIRDRRAAARTETRVAMPISIVDASLGGAIAAIAASMGLDVTIVGADSAPTLRFDATGTIAHALRVEVLRRWPCALKLDDKLSQRARAWLAPHSIEPTTAEDFAPSIATLSDLDDGIVTLTIPNVGAVRLGEPPEADAAIREAQAIRASVQGTHDDALPDGAEDRARAIVFGPSRTLSDPSSRRVLEAFGLTAAPWKLAENAARAVVHAKSFGFPVDIRVASPELSSLDHAGLATRVLRTPSELREAVRGVLRRARAISKDARVLGVTVSRSLDSAPQLRLAIDLESAAFGATSTEAMLRLELDDPIGRRLARPLVATAPIDASQAAATLARFSGRAVLPSPDSPRFRSLLAWLVRLGKVSLALSDALLVAELAIAPVPEAEGWMLTAARVRVRGLDVDSPQRVAATGS
jgi:hypothetical protein